MTTLQIIGLSVFSVLLIQWGLAFFCLMRLYKNKPQTLKTLWWNIIILLGVIVGPVCYLVIEKHNPRVEKAMPPNNEDGADTTMDAQAHQALENSDEQLAHSVRLAGGENAETAGKDDVTECDGSDHYMI